MEKKYTRKPIRNLSDLEKAQYRTRHMYKDMESDWVNTFLQPDTWAFSAGQYLLTRLFRKKRQEAATEVPARPSVRTRQKSRSGGLFAIKTTLPPDEKAGLAARIRAIIKGLRPGKKQTVHKEISSTGSRASRLLKNLVWSVIYWQAFRIGFRIGREGGRALRHKTLKKNRR